MKTNLKAALLSLLSVWTIVLAAAACESETRPSNTTWEAPSGRNPDASVERERYLPGAVGPYAGRNARSRAAGRILCPTPPLR